MCQEDFEEIRWVWQEEDKARQHLNEWIQVISHVVQQFFLPLFFAENFGATIFSDVFFSVFSKHGLKHFCCENISNISAFRDVSRCFYSSSPSGSNPIPVKVQPSLQMKKLTSRLEGQSSGESEIKPKNVFDTVFVKTWNEHICFCFFWRGFFGLWFNCCFIFFAFFQIKSFNKNPAKIYLHVYMCNITIVSVSLASCHKQRIFRHNFWCFRFGAGRLVQ